MGHIHMPSTFSRVHMFLPWPFCYPAFQPSRFVLGPSSSSSDEFHDSKLCFLIPFCPDEATGCCVVFPLGAQLPASWGPTAKHRHGQAVQRRGSTTEKSRFSSCICSILLFSLLCLCCFWLKQKGRAVQLRHMGDTNHFGLAFQGDKASTSPNEKLLL